MKMLVGGCRCGATRFKLDDVLDAGYCHCNQCRRRSGAPVFAFLTTKDRNFSLIAGKLVGEPSETTGTREYCERCRIEVSLNYDNSEFGKLRAIGIGLLDQPELIRPTYHQFMVDALPWLDIHDTLPRFQTNEVSHPRDRLSPFAEGEQKIRLRP